MEQEYINIFDREEITIPEDENLFLEGLSKPTLILVRGKNPDKYKFISCLIHGSEPSGFRAVHKELIQSKNKEYEESILFFIGNVSAAKIAPYYSKRFVPGEQNFNRVWNVVNPKTNLEKTVISLKKFIAGLKIIMAIDIHSFTSTSMPVHAYVLTNKSAILASKFTQNIFETDLKLGTSISMFADIPSLTLETGTNNTKKADLFASESLQKFIQLTEKELLLDETITFSKNSINVKVKPSMIVSFDPQQESDVYFEKCFESLNAKKITSRTLIGRCKSKDVFLITEGEFDDYFHLSERGDLFIKPGTVPTLISHSDFMLKESGFYLYKDHEKFHNNYNSED